MSAEKNFKYISGTAALKMEPEHEFRPIYIRGGQAAKPEAVPARRQPSLSDDARFAYEAMGFRDFAESARKGERSAKALGSEFSLPQIAAIGAVLFVVGAILVLL